MPQKLVNTIESPVRYPAVLHQALSACLQSPGLWVTALSGLDRGEARQFYRKLNTFSRAWAAFPSYDPRTTRALVGKKISGRIMLFGLHWSVQMRVVEQPVVTWKNILQSSSTNS